MWDYAVIQSSYQLLKRSLFLTVLTIFVLAGMLTGWDDMINIVAGLRRVGRGACA